MTDPKGAFLTTLYKTFLRYDANQLRLIHHLSGAMLQDARPYLSPEDPPSPYSRTFLFKCQHQVEFIFPALDPFRLAFFRDTFANEVCLSCLLWRITKLLNYPEVYEAAALKVGLDTWIGFAATVRWQRVATFTSYLADLPAETRTAWQQLSGELSAVFAYADGSWWLSNEHEALAPAMLAIARMEKGAFAQQFGRARRGRAAVREKALEQIAGSLAVSGKGSEA